ncbi:hypothetical protein LZK80_02525 [Rhizobium leguminosarum]|nr:hypothetical protein LZK80_02525 [Rhizobium leguminosarum]
MKQHEIGNAQPCLRRIDVGAVDENAADDEDQADGGGEQHRFRPADNPTAHQRDGKACRGDAKRQQERVIVKRHAFQSPQLLPRQMLAAYGLRDEECLMHPLTNDALHNANVTRLTSRRNLR